MNVDFRALSRGQRLALIGKQKAEHTQKRKDQNLESGTSETNKQIECSRPTSETKKKSVSSSFQNGNIENDINGPAVPKDASNRPSSTITAEVLEIKEGDMPPVMPLDVTLHNLSVTEMEAFAAAETLEGTSLSFTSYPIEPEVIIMENVPVAADEFTPSLVSSPKHELPLNIKQATSVNQIDNQQVASITELVEQCIASDQSDRNECETSNGPEKTKNIDDQVQNDLDEITLNTESDKENQADDSDTDELHNATGKRMPNKEHWARNMSKKLQMQGKSYKGLKYDKVCCTYNLSNERPAREQGPRCNSDKCKNSSTRLCDTVTENYRHEIFSKFWSEMTWDQRKVYISSLVDIVSKAESTTEGPSKRSYTFRYHLKLKQDRVQVCQLMFLNTFALNNNTVRNWIMNASDHGIPPKPKAKLPNKTKEEVAVKFLNSLPKLPSHYCRASSSKLYLEPIVNNPTTLFALFQKYIAEMDEQIDSISRNVLMNTFRRLNLDFYQPKKDQCDLCMAHELGNINDELYTAHRMKKDQAREEKARDKSEALEDCSKMCITMDLQSVLLTPKVNANAVYYKTKLANHNFTLFNLSNKRVSCYLWHEAEGNLTANSFASCVIDWLNQNIKQDVKQITIYSDGCSYQNKNSCLSNALLNYSVQKRVFIYQKYLTKGHTQMEVDSCHSVIERKMKGVPVYSPANLVQIIESTKYELNVIDHTFFHDFSNIAFYSSIRPGKNVGDAQVNDLVALKYSPDATIHYKLDFDEDWTLLPRRCRHGQYHTTKLLKEPIGIKPQKFKDLQDLKFVMPAYHHAFYDSLPVQK